MATLLTVPVKSANPKARIELESAWSRADQFYPPTGNWFGKPVGAMADDVACANTLAARSGHDIAEN